MNSLLRLIGKLIGVHDSPVHPGAAKKVLVVDLSYLGDLVMSAVTHRAIRKNLPAAKIHLLGFPVVGHMLPLLPVVDKLHAIPKEGLWGQMRTAWKLRAEKFDVAIHLNTGLRVNFLMYLTGAKIRLGYDYRGRGCFHTIRIPIQTRTVKSGYRRDECLDLLRSGFGWEGSAGIPALSQDAGAGSSIESKLRGWGIVDGDFVVGIHTNSRQDREIRCWDDGKFAEVANYLIGEHDAKILFTDVASDRPLVEPILSLIGRQDRVVDAMGQISIPELYALLPRVHLFLSVNTAPMHLAVDAGTPLVAILGYAPPHIYFPPGDIRFQYVMDASLERYDPQLITQTVPSKIKEIEVGEVLEKVEYLIREVLERKK